MKNRRLETGAPNYKSFIEHVFLNDKLMTSYMEYIYNNDPSFYYNLLSEMGISSVDLNTDINNLADDINKDGISSFYDQYMIASSSEDCPTHIGGFKDYLETVWNNEIAVELSQIEDFNEIFQNTNEDNFDFGCEEMGLSYLFSLLNSQNTTTLRNTMINQVQGSGISTEQQKKTWLINWYFANDPMGSIYLATLGNPALVASYQTSPGMLYGSPFALGMENYFIKIKTHFGQSMFDQLVTEFAQQSNLYVDEIKVDEYNIYGSSRLGVYESNKLIGKRVARDLNLDNQITSNEYVIETPEEVTYLFSSYQLERGAKRYELANHLGNVLTVISDKKTAVFTGTTFNYFTAERISATDYSPFGAPLASRTWNGGEYRFGFNSMEKDNEINGAGNAYDFGARIYDARLGRWLSVDPLSVNYPSLSPYLFAGNNPTLNVDVDGRRIIIYYKDNKGKTKMYTYGSKNAIPNNKFVIQTVQALNHIKNSDPNLSSQVNQVSTDAVHILKIKESNGDATKDAAIMQAKNKKTGKIYKDIFTIKLTEVNNYEFNTGTIPFNPTSGLMDPTSGSAISPSSSLAHEFGHAWMAFYKPKGFILTSAKQNVDFGDEQEQYATLNFEHKVAKKNGEWLRNNHSTGVGYTTVSPTSIVPAPVTNESQLGAGNSVEIKGESKTIY